MNSRNYSNDSHSCRHSLLYLLVLLLIFIALYSSFAPQTSDRTCDREKFNLTLDTEYDYNISRSEWQIDSYSVREHLYYFEDPENINKTLLNLTDPSKFNLHLFKGVKGIWVFPHRYFPESKVPPVPAETLTAKFQYSSPFQLLDHAFINYYAQGGAEVKIYYDALVNGGEESVTLGTNMMPINGGWTNQSFKFPTSTAHFRIELHAPKDRSFVFLDKITAGANTKV